MGGCAELAPLPPPPLPIAVSTDDESLPLAAGHGQWHVSEVGSHSFDVPLTFASPSSTCCLTTVFNSYHVRSSVVSQPSHSPRTFITRSYEILLLVVPHVRLTLGSFTSLCRVAFLSHLFHVRPTFVSRAPYARPTSATRSRRPLHRHHTRAPHRPHARLRLAAR